ncbi:hypothetical protein TIFTF001_026204 [Ficus carica]|uniref:Uncharacterized protein n=1 Tax=Ficus carica TaxID=3494 RepID=A0AA88IT27_FICCA|nr:hypothetical protein TIFTF001_026204 [Ficus carica]
MYQIFQIGKILAKGYFRWKLRLIFVASFGKVGGMMATRLEEDDEAIEFGDLVMVKMSGMIWCLTVIIFIAGQESLNLSIPFEAAKSILGRKWCPISEILLEARPWGRIFNPGFFIYRSKPIIKSLQDNDPGMTWFCCSLVDRSLERLSRTVNARPGQVCRLELIQSKKVLSLSLR